MWMLLSRNYPWNADNLCTVSEFNMVRVSPTPCVSGRSSQDEEMSEACNIRNACKILFGKLEGKRLRERHRRRWEDYNGGNRVGRYGLDASGSG